MNLTIDVIPAWQLLTYSSSSKSKGLAFWKPVALGKKKNPPFFMVHTCPTLPGVVKN